MLIASIPNIAHWSVRLSLFFGIFEYKDVGLLDSGHLRFFTLKSAKKIIYDSGYKVDKFDVIIEMPRGFNRLCNFLRMDKIFKKIFTGFFANQFIFILKKKND
jgi:hypothetical protein